METTIGAKSDDASSDCGSIVVLNRDLMFGMRIRNAVRDLGHDIVVVPDTAGFVAAMRSRDPAPLLGVIDMNAKIEWDLVRQLSDDPTVATALLGFGPHVDSVGRRAAKAAGVDRIVSNGQFHREMIDLLRRYALHTAPPDPADGKPLSPEE